MLIWPQTWTLFFAKHEKEGNRSARRKTLLTCNMNHAISGYWSVVRIWYFWFQKEIPQSVRGRLPGSFLSLIFGWSDNLATMGATTQAI